MAAMVLYAETISKGRNRTGAERQRRHLVELALFTPMRRANSAVFCAPTSCMTCAVIVFFE